MIIKNQFKNEQKDHSSFHLSFLLHRHILYRYPSETTIVGSHSRVESISLDKTIRSHSQLASAVHSFVLQIKKIRTPVATYRVQFEGVEVHIEPSGS